MGSYLTIPVISTLYLTHSLKYFCSTAQCAPYDPIIMTSSRSVLLFYYFGKVIILYSISFDVLKDLCAVLLIF